MKISAPQTSVSGYSKAVKPALTSLRFSSHLHKVLEDPEAKITKIGHIDSKSKDYQPDKPYFVEIEFKNPAFTNHFGKKQRFHIDQSQFQLIGRFLVEQKLLAPSDPDTHVRAEVFCHQSLGSLTDCHIELTIHHQKVILNPV